MKINCELQVKWFQVQGQPYKIHQNLLTVQTIEGNKMSSIDVRLCYKEV